MSEPFRAALAQARAGLTRHFGLHHRLHQNPQPLPQEVDVSVMRFLHSSSSTAILSLAIALTSFIFVVDEGDAVPFIWPGPAVSYTTSWDTTV